MKQVELQNLNYVENNTVYRNCTFGYLYASIENISFIDCNFEDYVEFTGLLGCEFKGCDFLNKVVFRIHQEIPEHLADWFFITNLVCEYLKKLPKNLSKLSSLKNFTLHMCSFESPPKQIGDLTSLQSLYFCESDIKELPKEIVNLQSLVTLEICNETENYPGLTNLPPEIGKLASLKRLVLGDLFLENIPKEIGEITSLNTLIIDVCPNVKKLPGIDKLKSLKHLTINIAYLKELPQCLDNLKSLEGLHLTKLYGQNEEHKIPEVLIRSLDNLTLLELSCLNKPQEFLNEIIKELSHIKHLNFYGCIIPEKFDALEKFSVTTLEFCECQINEVLPSAVGNVTSLTYLNLHECYNIQQLPEEIGNLNSLTRLDFTNNSYNDPQEELQELPKEIGNLNSLTHLSLTGCSQLKKLPKEIDNLHALTVIKN
ncbi:leucine-rich repeat domain-containing protein [Candidatus Uabimicrobium sp. HlEnr_7]|uniref:leucine-rich repeat domain-containing protein n=1 Tax=Candidatus Uabimicrobium helgolandensis TaxID=3095367 RepID=UPI0035592452